MIPESHPLQQLFQDLVGQHYAHEIGIRDPQVVAYVSHLLAEFCEADQLFKIKDALNRQLSDVGEMMLETDPVYGPAIASARYASTSATSLYSLPACSPRASITSAYAASAWRTLSTG
jgi:hypothetical protein